MAIIHLHSPDQFEGWMHLKPELKGHPDLRTKTLDPVMETLSMSQLSKCQRQKKKKKALHDTKGFPEMLK